MDHWQWACMLSDPEFSPANCSTVHYKRVRPPKQLWFSSWTFAGPHHLLRQACDWSLSAAEISRVGLPVIGAGLTFIICTRLSWACGLQDPKAAAWSHLSEGLAHSLSSARLMWLMEMSQFGFLVECSLMLILVILKAIHKQYIPIIASLSFPSSVDGCLYIAPNGS